MDKKSNMKKAMYEMFGVGGDGSEAASTAPAQVKSASVEVKSAPGAEKKSVDHAPVKTPEARPAASFLAPGTVFEGSFRAKGDIEIAGELKGDVTSEGSVLLRSNLQSNITAGSQLAAMQEQLPSTAPEGGEPTPAEPEPPAAEVPAYTELYPELYADDSLRGTVDVDNAVYLTFDDGPSARTDEILEILDKYGVKATFFVVGANEEGDLERMQKIVAAGHTLAIHSYSHDYKKIYASVEAYLEDFNQMFCQIYEATGVKPQIFRFPGGSVNSYNVGIHQQLIAEMTRRGFVYFDWNVANGDAVFSKIQPSSTLTANALKGVGTARRAIILMHDSSAKTTTVEALPAIIEGYLEAGYSFAALTPSTRSVTFSYLD